MLFWITLRILDLIVIFIILILSCYAKYHSLIYSKLYKQNWHLINVTWTPIR
jgi:hypothetical protein